MAASEKKNSSSNYSVMSQTEVPTGRNGKHKAVVTMILSDLDSLKPGKAIRIPLEELDDTKENVRSALNRAVHKLEIEIATSTDEKYLYVWRPTDGQRS
jgi:DNA helicase TIP49 (TBP-interacting protein)